MSDSRPIQRYSGNVPANPAQGASIMTPNGPAVIQVIDMAGGGLGPATPPTFRRKPGGINVLGAVTRRWWLVLVVFVIVGGGAYLAGANIKPTFEARAKIGYYDNNPNSSGGGIGSTVAHKGLDLLNARDIPLRAWHTTQLRSEFPEVAAANNLDDPVQQAALLRLVKNLVDYDDGARGSSIVDIIAIQPSPEKANAVANAYAQAFVDYCTDCVQSSVQANYKSLQDEIKNDSAMFAALKKKEAQLKSEYNFDAVDRKLAGTLDQVQAMTTERGKDEVIAAAAQAKYDALKTGKKLSAAQQLDAIKMREEDEAKDAVLKTYTEGLATAYTKVAELQSQGMTEQHPLMIAAKHQVEVATQNVEERKKFIATKIEALINRQFELQTAKTVEEAQQALAAAQAQLGADNKLMADLEKQSGELGKVKIQIDELEYEASEFAKQESASREDLHNVVESSISTPTAVFKVEQMAMSVPKADTRIKVQAGGLVGGLFLGILLSLLVDKFDKRLRDPRDIEPLLGTPLLGTIPRISELKRIKGDQARNLIAEEFRIIRTQILFGNPNLIQKLIAITSPSPGDGKTSLAVNLAISIAKAGRRVLLIDGDLRKPDVHRVFNISDSPGFAEIIQGSHEPGAVIKKTEVDGLEVLPAGTPISRPSELLSRPEMARLLAALSELYDHIVLDTAPLLPVSDTHVLVGMMDGVIVSFNAEVDRDTVAMTQDILRRNRANVIGSVMNQVKYKQSGSYQRGKSAYDSYYNSPRGAPSVKSDKLTTVGK